MNTFNYHTHKPLHELDMRCPPLPQTLLEAMELTHQPEGPPLEQIIDMVQHDPVVVARILRIVNSPYYGQRGQVTNIRRAVLVMGPVSVLGVIMSMSLVEVRTALDEHTTAPFINLVRHSVATGFLAQRMLLNDPGFSAHGAERQERGSEAFTAGIMHDFGKLLLLYNHPEEAAAFYGTPSQDAVDALLEAERGLFDYNHVETGIYFAHRLKFPDALTTAIARHHAHAHVQVDQPGVARLIYAVAAANKAANAFGYTLNREGSWDDCSQDPIWQQMIDASVVGYTRSSDILQVIESGKEELASYVDAIF